MSADGWLPGASVAISKAHDVVLAQIFATVYFDRDPVDRAGFLMCLKSIK